MPVKDVGVILVYLLRFYLNLASIKVRTEAIFVNNFMEKSIFLLRRSYRYVFYVYCRSFWYSLRFFSIVEL